MCGWYWPPAVSFSRICAATVLEAQAPDGAEGLCGYGAEDVVKEFERYERLKKVSWRLGQGNEEFTFVREGNALASRCVLFIHLATAIGAIWLLEQPGQSILLSYYRINDIWRTVTGFRKRFWMSKFSGPTPKPHMVLSNHLAFVQGIAAGM